MLPGVVGETMDATLILLVIGDTSGWGMRLVEMGDGVLSVDGKEWKPEAPGLSALTPLYEAAEVSKSECQSCKCLRMTSAHWQSSARARKNTRLLEASVLEK